MSTLLALLGLGALGLAGCEESSGESTPELGEAESATLNGTALPEDTYEWLVRRTNGESCGGALVASNVVLTAAHCVTLGSGVEPANTSSDPLALAIEALGEDGSTVITFPIYELLEAGGDLALIVYPVDRAVPRSLLVPARVGASGEAPSATTKVASAVAHSFIPGCGCAVTGPASTITNGSVSPGVDGNGIATFEFDVSGSGRICKGDSGSPVLSNGRIVSLVATSVAVDAGCGPGTAPSDAFWGPALTNPSQRTWLLTNGLDRDGDGIEAWQDMCDTFPHRPVGSPQVDRDQDGVSAPCDLCDEVAYEGFYNWDGDDLIDCLDPCPLSPRGATVLAACVGTERGEHGDSDCDGICDDAEVCDFVPSPHLAANANAEAEERWGADEVPDACEPVLVPVGAVDTPKSTIELINSADTTFVKMATWVERRDWVTREHRPSRRIDGNSSVSVTGVPTHARFCQPGGLVPDCLAPQAIDEDELRLNLTPSTETSQIPYHRITLGSAVRGDVATRTYNGSVDSLQWSYEGDTAFWQASGVLQVPPDETNGHAPGVTTIGLDGIMWFHAASQVGHPGSPSNNIGTGVHDGPPTIDNSAQLASHYFAIDPASIQHSEKHYPLELDIPYFAWRDLPRWPDDYRDLFRGVHPHDDLMIFETTSQQFGYLTSDGLIQPLTELFSQSLQNALAAGYLWRRSEESWAAVALDGAPLAAAFDTGGTRLMDAIFQDPAGMGLVTIRETSLPLPEGAQTSAATGFQAVYARSMGAIFRVGGTVAGPSGPTASGGVWRFDARSGRAAPLRLPFALGTVVASTFDAITRELVVLDLVPASHGYQSLRLLRIDALGRSGRVVGDWRRDGPCTVLSLMVDGRGRTVVSANLPTTGRYSLYTLEGEGASFVSRRVVHANGTLLSAPWSNETAYALPVRTGTLATGTVSLKSQPLSTGSIANVWECF